MKISDIFKDCKRTYSFEFFPPKDEISAVDFGINVGQLLKLNPSFVTVTYGAGGSNRDKNFALVDYLQNKIGLNAMAHYTCVGATREKIAEDMKYLQGIGIQNLMLLRGDPPKGSTEFVTKDGGFSYASDLIKFVSTNFNFSIGAAAYPEKHPEAHNLEADLENLRRKYDAGAEFLITQLFFDNEAYYEFVTNARKKGINCRIIPGIIPITNYNQVRRFVGMTNAIIPAKLAGKLEANQDNPEKIYNIGIDHAIKQCIDLLEWGAPGLHFYTLNKSRAAVEVFESIPRSMRE